MSALWTMLPVSMLTIVGSYFFQRCIQLVLINRFKNIVNAVYLKCLDGILFEGCGKDDGLFYVALLKDPKADAVG